MTPSRVLAPGVVEYSATVPTGPGRYDRIGLHRVSLVGGRRPAATRPAVLLLHGDTWGFDAAFVGGPDTSQSLPVLLARRGIDVWGIDLGWTLVPRAETDFAFMANWGLQRDINDVRLALRLARAVRAANGEGNGKLSLLAWSRGGWIGYGLLDQEAAMPPDRRQAGAFISVDNLYKTDNADARDIACEGAQQTREALATGEYQADASVFADLGTLAQSDPDGISPIFGPPYTNQQASLDVGAGFFQGGGTFTPWYHFVGGTFPNGDTNQIPTALRYTALGRWNYFLARGSFYEPERLIGDTLAVSCDDGSTSTFDSNLANVHVPVLYVGAAGGFGTYGLYTLDLLGSRQVDTLIIRRRHVGDERTDFGHVDIFQARDARRLVWTPIANWLHGLRR